MSWEKFSESYSSDIDEAYQHTLINSYIKSFNCCGGPFNDDQLVKIGSNSVKFPPRNRVESYVTCDDCFAFYRFGFYEQDKSNVRVKELNRFSVPALEILIEKNQIEDIFLQPVVEMLRKTEYHDSEILNFVVANFKFKNNR